MSDMVSHKAPQYLVSQGHWDVPAAIHFAPDNLDPIRSQRPRRFQLLTMPESFEEECTRTSHNGNYGQNPKEEDR